VISNGIEWGVLCPGNRAYFSLQFLTNLSTPKATSPTAITAVTTSKGFEELRIIMPSLVKSNTDTNRKHRENTRKNPPTSPSLTCAHPSLFDPGLRPIFNLNIFTSKSAWLVSFKGILCDNYSTLDLDADSEFVEDYTADCSAHVSPIK
jgi:hypothetical protein